MSAIDICKAALERGVLRRVVNRKYPAGAWMFGNRVFSNQTVRALLKAKRATRAGGTVRKRDGVTWRNRSGQ